MTSSSKVLGTVNTEQTLTEEITTKDSLEPEIFHFWNGDVYEGEFARRKDKQRIVMQGRGVYRTSDGHVYDGYWDNDSMVSGTVTFPDKSSFVGELMEMRRTGYGSYKFKENIEIKGEFEDDEFVGTLVLIDPNDHLWKADVKRKDLFCSFVPFHIFWNTVLSLSEKSTFYYGDGGGESIFSE